jgi:hypothetical protein
MFPDEYQGFPQTFDANDPTVTTDANGRKVIQAGTIWPSNDANAKGVVFQTYDVTDGSCTGSVLFEGSIKTSKIPAAPSAAAKTALPRISWFPNLTAVAITTTSPLTNGKVGTAYTVTLAATPSTAKWMLVKGSLPAGLSLSTAGVISGTPTAVGVSTFTVEASTIDSAARVELTLTIAAATA